MMQNQIVLEVSPVLPNIESIVANSFTTVLLHELCSVTLDKVKAPAFKSNIMLQPLHPVHNAGSQSVIGVVQVCNMHSTSRYVCAVQDMVHVTGTHMRKA